MKSFWIYCLLALCSWSFAKECTWMKTGHKGSRSNFKVISNHSIYVLQDMGDEVSRGKMDAPFPHKLYKQAAQLQPEERTVFIYETINDIKKLFITGKYDAISWDQIKLETFQLDMDRQASELHQCIQNQKSESSHSTRRLTMKMRQYFKDLHNHLKKQRYSRDDWEDVRAVVLDHLLRLDLLGSSNKHNSS